MKNFVFRGNKLNAVLDSNGFVKHASRDGNIFIFSMTKFKMI